MALEPIDPAITARTIGAAGLATRYHEAGNGEPVLLLHGSGPGVSAWANWQATLPALAAAGHRVIAPDLPGFGDTERPADGRYGVPFWVAHLLALLDALGIERAALIGNSLGGSIALSITAAHPERISRLVLMGTPCGKFEVTQGLRAGRLFDGSEASLRSVLQLFPHDKALVTDAMVQSRLQASRVPGALDAFRSLVPAEPDGDVVATVSGVPEKVVARLAQPMLVLHGRDDAVVPAELGWRIHRAAARSEFHSFAACGHWVQLERAERFVELSRGFLRATAA